MTAQRDPVSPWFDAGAQELLARLLQLPAGTWLRTRVADPSTLMRQWLAVRGIDWAGPDNASTAAQGSGLNARDRWTRAFVRSVYYQWRAIGADQAGSLQLDIGRRVVPRGIIPAGRAVGLLYRRGGGAYRAARRLGDDDRIFDDLGRPAGRASLIELRDWQ